jgi:ATP-dependent helicase/nuclease subunit A
MSIREVSDQGKGTMTDEVRVLDPAIEDIHAKQNAASDDVGVEKPRDLREEQKLAAYTLDRHVSVTAGPGSGKTTVLIERYIEILRTQDISLDQIVAFTFTNRAANEMRERLRHELDELLNQASPSERARWMRYKRTLDGAIITTIHGFCARLLREFPVEADVDPQFGLLDAHESALLEESVAEQALNDFLGDQHPWITELAAGVRRSRLARGLIDIYRTMRNQGLTVEQVAVQTKTIHKTIEDYRSALNDLDSRMREFLALRGQTPAVETKLLIVRDRWPKLRELLINAPESNSPAQFSEALQDFREFGRPTSTQKIQGILQTLDQLIWDKDLRCEIPRIFFDLRAQKYTSELLALVARIERHLDEQKRQRSVLDFDDLQVRTLRLLEERPEVLSRAAARYRFFLVDEFQDTNGLQRDLLARLALGNRVLAEREPPRAVTRANLFIVGDRKQSIYGFRGADVDVFREMTESITEHGGVSVPLSLNFRSQPPLIRFFNFLFEKVFENDSQSSATELNELGHVRHEPSIAARTDEDHRPVVELLIDVRKNGTKDGWAEEQPRARDAAQIAARISTVVGAGSISIGEESRAVTLRDIAILFRAMTEVHLYESALRRAGIPYVTVDGKGFYAREEITDFVQLLRFLDNKTDEVALAAVLRSPICGISDNALLALRCAPLRTGIEELPRLKKFGGVRPLLDAVHRHDAIDFIDDADREALRRFRSLLNSLISRSRRSKLSDLLRFAVEASEYRIVASATFDGAQRLANLDKLFILAERFERSGAYMIRDFVRFVREFEEIGGRESEGQIDDSADAVRLMSIHQSKGLEFPVVIIPDLHRLPDNRREWWAVDRHKGFTLKPPDGRGRLSIGSAYSTFTERAKKRDDFESRRLLYVAATRAKDRLLLSGASKEAQGPKNSWLACVCSAVGVSNDSVSGALRPAEGVDVLLTLNLLDSAVASQSANDVKAVEPPLDLPEDESFPLLEPLSPVLANSSHRFSVTQLLNYQRCQRQYYFDRILHAPDDDERAVWNDAEAPEPPANLTATLRGAVIHKFCEKFREGDDLLSCLRTSFEDILKQRTAELGNRITEIDSEKALLDLMPLARNYAGSKVRERIEAARAAVEIGSVAGLDSSGVFSEQRFRLRRPLGILTGTIDKLVVTEDPDGRGWVVEIIDFKTNRFRRERDAIKRSSPNPSSGRSKTVKKTVNQDQLAFGFLEPEPESPERDLLVRSEVEELAIDYRIQMQAYALAVRDLIPNVHAVKVTLHFLDPDFEVSLVDDLLDRETCAAAIDRSMTGLVSSTSPEDFPVNPAEHCRICNFLDLCVAGRRWLRECN